MSEMSQVTLKVIKDGHVMEDRRPTGILCYLNTKGIASPKGYKMYNELHNAGHLTMSVNDF